MKTGTKLTFKNKTDLKHNVKQMKFLTFLKWRRDCCALFKPGHLMNTTCIRSGFVKIVWAEWGLCHRSPNSHLYPQSVQWKMNAVKTQNLTHLTLQLNGGLCTVHLRVQKKLFSSANSLFTFTVHRVKNKNKTMKRALSWDRRTQVSPGKQFGFVGPSMHPSVIAQNKDLIRLHSHTKEK